MSKNYRQKTPRPVDEPEVVETEEVIVDSVPENDESVVEETVALRGVVSNCTRLNVRVAPVMGATVACVIVCDAKVDVYPEKSTDEWYNICTEAGIEGFCMKQFISI